MSELPKGWVKIPLDQVATWGSGGTPKRSEPSYYGGDVPWVKTGDLGPKYLKEASEYISQLGLEKSSAKLFPRGSVAIAMYGATIGKTSTLDFEASTNQACAVGNPIDGVILTDFLYYFLTSEKQSFIKKGKGGAQPNISQQLIKAHEINLPSLPEQKRIVEKLDEVLAQVDTIKAHLDGIPAILKRFRQSVLAAAVSGKLTEEWRGSSLYDDEGFPIAWTRKGLDELGELARGKSKHRPRNDPKLFGDEYPFIQTGEVAQSNGLITGCTKWYSQFGLEQSKLFPKGTLCITIAANIADTAILDIDACFPDSVVGFTPIEEITSALFVKYLIDVNKNNLEQFAPATAQKNINLKVLKSLSLPYPCLTEQNEIVRLVEQYFAFADTIEAQVKKAQTRVDNLTQSILAKAFRGELVPQDPNDEPADKLLERIAAARKEAEALAKAAKKAAPKKRAAKKAT